MTEDGEEQTKMNGNEKEFLKEKADFVLLDMDGTLLDKRFDDYFWNEFVPETYAKRNGLPFEESRERLLARYKLEEGSLNWTDINFWSIELGLDIFNLKKSIEEQIIIHPYATEFLGYLKGLRKKVFLVTNAHHRTVEIKMEKTKIDGYFDLILSAFDVGAPKEKREFWQGAKERLGFEEEKSFLLDDNEEILFAARDFGIRGLFLKSRSTVGGEIRPSEHFPSVAELSDLIDDEK